MTNYMVGRDANRGECAHPCRWQYALMEQKRPGEYFPVEEDGRGTYVMNSKDLCMIEHLPDLLEAGATSLKIEGRMKSIYYLAVVVGAYRKALDDVLMGKPFDEQVLTELGKASHREFTTGFYYGKPGEEAQNYETSAYIRDYSFVGLVKGYEEETGFALVEQRNKMVLGDTVEVMGPGEEPFTQSLYYMTDEERTPIDSAPHAQQLVRIKMDKPVGENYMLRIRKEGE